MKESDRRPDESLQDWIARVKPSPDKPPPKQEFAADLIPEETKDTRYEKERSDIDAVLGRIDIVDAYNKYCGKMVVDPKGKRSNIMVRCPVPGHEDKTPSADLNLDKGDGGVWNCHRCQQGGDKYDLAAWHYGFDVPGYKIGDGFPKLREEMAKGLGWTPMVAGKVEWLERNQLPVQTAPPTESIKATVTPIVKVEFEETPIADPGVDLRGVLDWQGLPCCASGTTFLSTWMTEVSKTWQPDEFFLFLGFMALGLAVGNKVTLDDTYVVRANTMMCLVGGTGTGKSLSIHYLSDLLHMSLPWHIDTGAGVRHLPSSGSGEDLVYQMLHFTTDPITKEKTVYPVRGFWYEDEFEGLMSKVNRAGSTMRSNIMKFYDSRHPVSTSSRSSGTVKVEDHFLQILTTTQPKRLQALMSEGDATSGFLNRWLFVFGTPKFRPSFSTVRVDLTLSAKLLQDIRGWSSSGRTVHLDYDPVAYLMWDEFVQNQIRPLEDTDDVLVSRIEVQCKKLLLLMAINDKSTIILENHVQSIILMFPYLKRGYGAVEEEVGLDQFQKCYGAVRNYFETHPDSDITMRILASSSGARRFSPSDRLRAVLELERAGEIAQVPVPKSARTIKWKWVPDQPAPGGLAVVTPLRPQ